jgi:hypothetical protein
MGKVFRPAVWAFRKRGAALKAAALHFNLECACTGLLTDSSRKLKLKAIGSAR